MKLPLVILRATALVVLVTWAGCRARDAASERNAIAQGGACASCVLPKALAGDSLAQIIAECLGPCVSAADAIGELEAEPSAAGTHAEVEASRLPRAVEAGRARRASRVDHPDGGT